MKCSPPLFFPYPLSQTFSFYSSHSELTLKANTQTPSSFQPLFPTQPSPRATISSLGRYKLHQPLHPEETRASRDYDGLSICQGHSCDHRLCDGGAGEVRSEI